MVHTVEVHLEACHQDAISRAQLRSHVDRQGLSSMVIDAGMKLALIVVHCADLPTPELPALIESIDCVESAEDRLEVDVNDAFAVVLVKLNVFYRTELVTISMGYSRIR